MATDRKLRILCFARERFPTHRADVDVLFGRELVGRGHGIDIVMQAERADIATGPVPWYGRTAFVGRTCDGDGLVARISRQVLEILHDIRCLWTLARPAGYDAVQVRDKFLIAAAAVLICRSRGLDFFFWLSFPFPEADVYNADAGVVRFPVITRMRGRLAGWLLYRWIVPRAKHVFAQSERMKIAICEKGALESAVTAVPMGVDLGEAEGAGVAAGSADGNLVLGYLGTLDANRQLGILIEMLRMLHDHGVFARLLLIGDAHDPADRRALEQRAEAAGLRDYVEITGMLPRAVAMLRMREAVIGLSPIVPSPIFDVGSPTKLVEYFALGVPVVANAHPEQREVMRACHGGVCVPWSARQFARGVRWLLERPAQERQEMVKRGRDWAVRNRSYRRIADMVEARYLQLLSGGAGDRS